MINWRQLYNESQVIQPDDTNVSIEKISRLVNIYKNDMIERELQRYCQRLTKISRCCQICTIKSYTTYKWIDTYISGEKNLFDFRLSGRSISALVYYWNKVLKERTDKRGQLKDFKQINENRKEKFSISILSNIDDNILIKKHFFTDFISNLFVRFQMYYTYRKAQRLSPTIQVHIQPMKTFRYLFQTNISPIFVCFMNETNNLSELFWIFRHLITIFNWPLTTKIFSDCSFEKNSSLFERLMMNSLGFIDLSSLRLNQTEYFHYLYRCLKTCNENGPIIFLFNSSKPKSCDYYLMSFLCDLIRSDLSISDVLIIPTCLYKSYLSFSQPFLFKELIDSFIKNFNIEKPLFELIQSKEKEEKEKIVFNFIDCLFLHLDYDVNQLIPTRIEFSHIIAAIDLCQINSSATIFHTLENLIKTCAFISTDNHKWNEITEEHIERYLLKYPTIDLKSKLISILRKEYLFDILSALTILSKIDENFRILENENIHQMKFLLFIFNYQIRSCENLQQKILQHYQLRNYISVDYIPQKSMCFRDIIQSDHEWSDEEDDINEDFFDHDEDEFVLNDLSNKISQPFYQINYQENSFQLKFFAKLFAPYIEAIIYVLKYHLEKQLMTFTLDGFNFQQKFHYQETSYLITNQILELIQRAYVFDTDSQVIDPLSTDKLVILHDEFVRLFDCLS